MDKRATEWLRQADYDMETARHMVLSERYIYAVFMCHLAIEKALKGLYSEKKKALPPKTHNLIYLLNEIGIVPGEKLGRFIAKLSEASIPTRYPEDLNLTLKNYTADVAKRIIEESAEVMGWIKSQF